MPPSDQAPIELSRTKIHRGVKFDLEELTLQPPPTSAGSREPVKRHIIRHPGAVVIVPMLQAGATLPNGQHGDSSEPHLLLIRNYRVAPARWLLEFPAGTIERPRLADGSFAGDDQTESPEYCAGRELVEETGYQAGKLTGLGSFLTTPGMTDERMHAFVATDLRFVGQELEEDEQIFVQPTPLSRVESLIVSNEIADAKSIAAWSLARLRGLLR